MNQRLKKKSVSLLVYSYFVALITIREICNSLITSKLNDAQWHDPMMGMLVNIPITSHMTHLPMYQVSS